MGTPLIFWKNRLYHWIRRSDVSYLMYKFVELQNIVIFYEKPHFTKENFKFWEAGEGRLNFWIKVQKDAPLRQNWSNK